MPIYEFACQQCGHEFETLTRASVQPACPQCHSHELAKKLSVFATAGTGESRVPESAPMAAGPCGSCGHPGGPGACAWND